VRFVFKKGVKTLTIQKAILHTDTLLNKYKDDLYDFNILNEDFHIDLSKLKKSNVKIIVFAVYAEENYLPKGDGLKKTIQMIDNFYNIIESCDELQLAKNTSDLNNISKDNKIAALLALEGAKSIFDLSALRVFYRLGLRLITLTWNYRNQFADGVGEHSNCGLTEKGKELIQEMNRLNILIDVSHINEAGFWDVIELSRAPIIASHSNAKAICSHQRNLNDQQIKAIADKKGVIGVNFCPAFLTKKKEASIKDVMHHIDYIKNLVGDEFVALGTDFDGIRSVPKGLENAGKLNKLKDLMVNNGYKAQQIENIFYKNAVRVLKNVMD